MNVIDDDVVALEMAGGFCCWSSDGMASAALFVDDYSAD